MGENKVSLASLIGSRICHDLISPIGAIANGLELLDMTGSTDGPEFELIADSAGNAGARIRFFRIAYGAAGDQSLSRAEVRSILDDLNRGARVRVNWGPLEPQSRAMVRLAFLAAQCCETALPYGGDVFVRCIDDHWSITATGDTVNVDPELWTPVQNGTAMASPTAALVQFALLPEIASDLGRRIAVSSSTNELVLEF